MSSAMTAELTRNDSFQVNVNNDFAMSSDHFQCLTHLFFWFGMTSTFRFRFIPSYRSKQTLHFIGRFLFFCTNSNNVLYNYISIAMHVISCNVLLAINAMNILLFYLNFLTMGDFNGSVTYSIVSLISE